MFEGIVKFFKGKQEPKLPEKTQKEIDKELDREMKKGIREAEQRIEEYKVEIQDMKEEAAELSLSKKEHLLDGLYIAISYLTDLVEDLEIVVREIKDHRRIVNISNVFTDLNTTFTKITDVFAKKGNLATAADGIEKVREEMNEARDALRELSRNINSASATRSVRGSAGIIEKGKLDKIKEDVASIAATKLIGQIEDPVEDNQFVNIINDENSKDD